MGNGMGYSKRQFISAAFEEVGLASYVFDLQPQQIESALRRLDAMMAEWNAKGIRLGYPLPNSPESSDLSAESQVPDSANEAIITNLAIRIAPSYGKNISQDTKIVAKRAYDTLLSRATVPEEQQLSMNMPLGAGHKARSFTRVPLDPVSAGPDANLRYN